MTVSTSEPHGEHLIVRLGEKGPKFRIKLWYDGEQIDASRVQARAEAIQKRINTFFRHADAEVLNEALSEHQVKRLTFRFNKASHLDKPGRLPEIYQQIGANTRPIDRDDLRACIKTDLMRPIFRLFSEAKGKAKNKGKGKTANARVPQVAVQLGAAVQSRQLEELNRRLETQASRLRESEERHQRQVGELQARLRETEEAGELVAQRAEELARQVAAGKRREVELGARLEELQGVRSEVRRLRHEAEAARSEAREKARQLVGNHRRLASLEGQVPTLQERLQEANTRAKQADQRAAEAEAAWAQAFAVAKGKEEALAQQIEKVREWEEELAELKETQAAEVGELRACLKEAEKQYQQAAAQAAMRISQGTLASLTSTSQAGGKGKQAQASVPDPAENYRGQMQTSASGVAQAVSQLVDRTSGLQKQLEEARAQVRPEGFEFQEGADSNSEAGLKIRELQEQVAKLHEQLQESMALADQMSSAMGELQAKNRHEIEQLQREHERADLQAARKAEKQLKALQAKLSAQAQASKDLEGRVAAAEHLLRETRHAANVQLRKAEGATRKSARLGKEKAELVKAHEADLKELKESQQKVLQLIRRIKQLEANLSENQRETELSRSAVKEAEEVARLARQSKGKAELALAGAEERLGQLNGRLTALRDENTKTEAARRSDQESFRQQLLAVQVRAEEERVLGEKRTEELTLQRASAERELGALHQQIDAKQARMAALEQENAERVAGLELQRKEVARLEKELEATKEQAARKAQESAQRAKGIETGLRQQVAELQLARELAEAQHEQEVEVLQGRLERAKEAISRKAEEMMRDLTEQQQAVGQLKAHVLGLEKEKAASAEQLRALKELQAKESEALRATMKSAKEALADAKEVGQRIDQVASPRRPRRPSSSSSSSGQAPLDTLALLDQIERLIDTRLKSDAPASEGERQVVAEVTGDLSSLLPQEEEGK